jgi:hypothetical protein
MGLLWPRVVTAFSFCHALTLKQEQIPSYQYIMEVYMREVIERAEEFHPDSLPDEAPWI